MISKDVNVFDTHGQLRATGIVHSGLYRIGNTQCIMVENSERMVFIPPNQVGAFSIEKVIAEVPTEAAPSDAVPAE